jgi:DNA-binding PadR family transcriptional regulator
MSRSADDFLPLKPVVVHILLALSAGDSHGYGVIQAVRAHSDGRIQLETGPFYRHLNRLLDDGLVEDSGTRPVDVDTRRGAYYRLTPLGGLVLSAEEERLAKLLSLTRSLSGAAREGSA